MGNGPHILVVHATVSECERLRALADNSHARAEFFETSAEALQRLALSNDFDAVFIGIERPDRENCDILDSVRNTSPPTPVVVISPADDMAIYLACLRRGVYDYIVRPVDWDKFGRIYARALHRRPVAEMALAQTA